MSQAIERSRYLPSRGWRGQDHHEMHRAALRPQAGRARGRRRGSDFQGVPAVCYRLGRLEHVSRNLSLNLRGERLDEQWSKREIDADRS